MSEPKPESSRIERNRFRLPRSDSGRLILSIATFTSKGIAATVVTSSFLGSFRRTQVRLDDDTVVAVQHDVSERHEPGDSVSLSLKGSPVSVLAQS